MWDGKKQAEVKQERRHVTKIKEEPMRKKIKKENGKEKNDCKKEAGKKQRMKPGN